MSTAIASPGRAAHRSRGETTLLPIGPGRWRVLDASGLIIGHVDTRPGMQGVRYRALRYRPASRGFLELGGFWSLDDAVDCLRAGR